MRTYRSEYFITRDFGFYDSGILGVLPKSTFDIYEVMRRWVWRSLEIGTAEIRKLFAENKLATMMSQSEIAEYVGNSRKNINNHIALMKELGWVVVLPPTNGGVATYVLGERVPDGAGHFHEAFYADAWMKSLWDELNAYAKKELGEKGKIIKLPWETRRDLVRRYIARTASGEITDNLNPED